MVFGVLDAMVDDVVFAVVDIDGIDELALPVDFEVEVKVV